MTKQESNKVVLTIVGLVVVIAIVVALVVRNHSNSATKTPTPAQASADKQKIEANWKAFFSASTSLSNREKLLQNGSSFSQPIQTEFSALSTQKSSAVVNSISLVNSTSANVLYTVELNGQPVLSGQQGQALLVNNSWVVSDKTLCTLLSLGGSNPPACKNL